MKPALRFIAAYAVLTVALGGLALLQSFPAHPTSLHGWLLLFALAVPVTIFLEFVGDLLFRNPVSQAVERRTKHTRLSLLRVLVGLALMLVAFAGLFVVGKLLS